MPPPARRPLPARSAGCGPAAPAPRVPRPAADRPARCPRGSRSWPASVRGRDAQTWRPSRTAQRARRFCCLRRLLRAWVLLGGRGGGRLPEAVAGLPPAGAVPFLGLRFFDLVLRRASRKMNQPIAMITSTPPMKSPNTPSVLTVGSVELVFELLGVEGVGVVGGGSGAGWAGASGPNAPPPPGAGAGAGCGTGVGAPDRAAAGGAASQSASRGRGGV